MIIRPYDLGWCAFNLHKHLVSMRTITLSACAQAPCQHARKRLVSMRASTLSACAQAPYTVAHKHLVSMRASTKAFPAGLAAPRKSPIDFL